MRQALSELAQRAGSRPRARCPRCRHSEVKFARSGEAVDHGVETDHVRFYHLRKLAL